MYNFVDTTPVSDPQVSVLSLRSIFNGMDLDESLTDDAGSFTTLTVSGRSNTIQRIYTQEIREKDGLIEQNKTSLEAREVIIKFKLADKTSEGFRQRFNRLNDLLTGSKKVLSFTDEDAFFYATLSELEVPEEDSNNMIGTITFLCSDPYKYGQEQGPYSFQDDAITIANQGTAEAYPVIQATAKESVTSFMVAKGEQDYFMIGRPLDIDKEAVDAYEEIRRWRMDNLTGWSHMTAGFLLDDEVSGGTVSGSRLEVYNGSSFTPSSYGSGYSGWHGPAVRRSLPEGVQDFSITFGCIAVNQGNGLGKVMAIFLDENDDIVCSVGLINSRMGTRNMRVLARMNDGDNIRRRRVMDYHGDAGPDSTVFSNRPLNIQLKREGNRFMARTWQVDDDGLPHARHGEEFIDNDPKFQRPIRQVVLFFAKYGNYDVFPMRIYGVRVNRSNVLLDDQIPYIAHEGDEILIDSQNELVMINDEPMTELKDFGSNYFMLDKGQNHLFTFPQGAFDASVKWRERFR